MPIVHCKGSAECFVPCPTEKFVTKKISDS